MYFLKAGLVLLVTLMSSICVSQSVDFSSENVISTNAEGAHSVHSADLDGDGDLDVLSASRLDDKIAWYENDGVGNFGEQNLISTQAYIAWCVFSADMDGDGDMDVLSASNEDDIVAWYENDGGGNFGEQIVISTNADEAKSVHAADLDGDGDMDVLSASCGDDKIAWYENDGNGVFGGQIVISLEADNARCVYGADLDGDGDIDVLSASNHDDKIAWYENDGNGIFGDQNVISTDAWGALTVYSGDLDGDGDMDVLSASYLDDKIAWYANDGSGNFGDQNIITTAADAAHSVYCQDLDGDGDLDVLSASTFENKIAWYENDGNGAFGEQHIITLNADYANTVYGGDLDGDGDLDVLSSSDQDDKIAWYENLYGEGCMDPGACNFDPEAFIESMCCYICACMDPEAENYNSLAECDDGSCTYKLTGCVFYDEDEDGIWDENEYGLPNQQIVTLPVGWLSYTNDEGGFSIQGVSPGDYMSELIPTEGFPFLTTPNLLFLEIDGGSVPKLEFGVSNELPHFGICVDFYPPGNGYPCNDWVNHNICYRNEGNLPIDGVVEVEYNPLFQNFMEMTPIDSVVDNHVYMSFENLLPGQMYFYDVGLLTPTVDYIGEFVSSISRVYGYYEDNMVAYGEQQLNVEMTCSYDPNDKQVFPNGYAEPHLILDGTELEYLVRFQNTGNAPATHVLVQDTLDENLDLSTFQLMANSHSVMTTVNPNTRLVDFYFEEIMLPDSNANEPESHGLVSYIIRPLMELEPGTEINNTGYIYFDNNPAIVTNTTWNTTHECGGESEFTVGSALICDEFSIGVESTYPLIEDYDWVVDGEQVSTEPEFDWAGTDETNYEITFTASNPLCEESTTVDYEVVDVEGLNPCQADFNCDGHRTTTDLLVFLEDYGCTFECMADLDDDGVVDVYDLLTFLTLFNNDCWE